MINSSAKDIAILLQDELELEFSKDLFVGREPATVCPCVTIFDTPGSPPMLALTGENYEYPSIQIRVRHSSYELGYHLINEIENTLHGRALIDMEDFLYTLIQSVGSPQMLDWDENNRVRFIVNFEIQRKRKEAS